MAQSSGRVEVYLEVGKSRVFAGALHWPGWCRSGPDEDSALHALLAYGPRYARAIEAAGLGFEPPADGSAFVVAERLTGTSTTDFGAPAVPPSVDAETVDTADLERFRAVLEACWRTFDAAVEAASERGLRKGPRGGGRELDRIVEHVMGAEAGYLTSLGWKPAARGATEADEAPSQLRQEMLRGLEVAAAGEIPARGPRGGTRWSPRYFVRREAWHVLDHAWEIEDRSQ